MKFMGAAWQSVRFLFHFKTGMGKKPESLSGDSEAFAAVFLPLAGLSIGFLAAVAAVLVQEMRLYTISIIAGLAVLAIFGGARQFIRMSALFPEPGRPAGAAVVSVLILLFEFYAIYETGSYRGARMVFPVLLYLPVAGALAMVSAASVLCGPAGEKLHLSGVKGGHMILCAVLSFVLMLPQLGLSSLVFIAVSVLAGSVTALVLDRRNKREVAVFTAGIVSEILFLAAVLLLNRPQIYY